jgi:hypothetical protein
MNSKSLQINFSLYKTGKGASLAVYRLKSLCTAVNHLSLSIRSRRGPRRRHVTYV